VGEEAEKSALLSYGDLGTSLITEGIDPIAAKEWGGGKGSGSYLQKRKGGDNKGLYQSRKPSVKAATNMA